MYQLSFQSNENLKSQNWEVYFVFKGLKLICVDQSVKVLNPTSVYRIPFQYTIKLFSFCEKRYVPFSDFVQDQNRCKQYYIILICCQTFHSHLNKLFTHNINLDLNLDTFYYTRSTRSRPIIYDRVSSSLKSRFAH